MERDKFMVTSMQESLQIRIQQQQARTDKSSKTEFKTSTHAFGNPQGQIIDGMSGSGFPRCIIGDLPESPPHKLHAPVSVALSQTMQSRVPFLHAFNVEPYSLANALLRQLTYFSCSLQVEAGAIVAAGSMVTPGKRVPAGQVRDTC
eukprot:401535-Pelagomonas_calceolata.AAC.2